MDGDPAEIVARGLDEIRGRHKCLAGGLCELGPFHAGLAKSLADLISHSLAEIGMIKHRGREGAPKTGSIAVAVWASRRMRGQSSVLDAFLSAHAADSSAGFIGENMGPPDRVFKPRVDRCCL